MKKIILFITLFVVMSIGVFSQSVTVTYTLGDIETMYQPYEPSGFLPSTCPGSLTVNIPANNHITGVDVSYSMTASNDGWMMDQASWLYCPTISAGEPTIADGVGASAGTMDYNRNGLTFANGATDTVVFELHAIQTFVDEGCSTVNNKVDSNTWVLTVYYDITPSCPAPGNLFATNITTTTAELSWTPSGSETLWNIELGNSGFTPTGTPSVSSISNPYVYTGLIPNTSYEYYVQADCGGGDLSTWEGPFAFITGCSEITVFNENFEAVTPPALPACWVKLGTGSVITQSSPYSSYSIPNYLEMHSYSSTNMSIVTIPPLSNAGAGTHYLKFMASCYPYDGGIIEIGYLTDPTDTATFVLLDSIILTTNYTEFSVFPETAPGTNKFLAFKAYHTPSYEILIDDVSWQQMSSCPGVNFLSAANITPTTADLSWNELGTATTWKIQWGLSEFTLGNGTIVSTTNNPYTLSGLNENTSYDYYVQSDCGGGSLSPWAGPFLFTTECAIVTVPFFEGFETSQIHNTPVANCWIQSTTLAPESWIANNTFTDYNRTPRTGNYNAFLSFYHNTWMFKGITLNAGTSYTFEMYARQDIPDTTNALITVAYGNTPSEADMTDTIVPRTSIVNGQYQLLIGVFTPTTTGTYYIGINGIVGASTWYLSIDDISLYETPDCPPPIALYVTNVTTTAVDLGWSGDTEPSWQIEYGLDGFSQGSGTYVTANSNPYTLTGLQHSTMYDFYVRAICDTIAGDTSSWSTSYTFATGCDTFAVPIFENFDAVITPQLPLCWNKIEEAINTYANIISSTVFTYSAPNNIKFYNEQDINATLILITPEISVPLNSLFVKFFARNNETGSDLILGTISDIDSADTFTPVDTIFLTSEYAEYCVFLNNISTTDKRLAFKHLLEGPYKIVFLDDITIGTIPTCLWVTGLSVDSTTQTTATLSWTSGGTENKWQIEYGLAGFAQGSGTYVTANSNPYTLTGLQHSTMYDFYVRAICDTIAGDTSFWAGPVSFLTQCGAINQFPYTEDFSATTFPPYCWTRWIALLLDNTVFAPTSWGWEQGNFGNVSTPDNKAARLNIYGSAIDYWLVTPSIDLGSSIDYLLSFDIALTKFDQASAPDQNGIDDKFAVVISTDDGATWSSANILRIWDNAGSSYVYNNISLTGQNVMIDLSPYSGIVKIGFYAESLTINTDNDLFVDNVTIFEKSPCTAPTLSVINIEDTKAVIAWTSDSPLSSEYQVEWDTAGFTLGTGNLITTSLTSDTLVGLTHNISYEFYARTICLFNDTSNWAGPEIFITLTTNINNLNEILAIEIYPNPNNGLFNVKILSKKDIVALSIFNIQGQIIYQNQLSGMRNGSAIEMNLKNLSAGIYFIRINDGQSVINKKLIVNP